MALINADGCISAINGASTETRQLHPPNANADSLYRFDVITDSETRAPAEESSLTELNGGRTYPDLSTYANELDAPAASNCDYLNVWIFPPASITATTSGVLGGSSIDHVTVRGVSLSVPSSHMWFRLSKRFKSQL